MGIIAATCALLLLTTALLLPRAPHHGAPQLVASSVDAAVQLDTRVERRSGLPDFLDASPGCPRCMGLPVERRFTRSALTRWYAVIIVSSHAECWSLDDAGEGSELAAVASIIKWWTEERFPQLAGLPLVGISASSGGFFVSALAARIRFNSITGMIAEGVYKTMDNIPAGYPSALFVHKPKDAETTRDVAASIGMLKAKRVDVREIECDHFAVSAEFTSLNNAEIFEWFESNMDH